MCVCVCVWTHALHGDLEVGEVVEAHGDAGGGDRRPVDLEQLLDAAAADELHRKLLVAQQRRQVLQHGRPRCMQQGAAKRGQHAFIMLRL